MILIKERIGKMLEYLQAQVYPKQVAIPSYKMIRTEERCLDVKNLDLPWLVRQKADAVVAIM